MGRGGNANKISFGVLKKHYDYFWLCQILIYCLSPPLPETKNYLLSSTLTKMGKIWGIGLDWRRILYSEVGMTSGQNSGVLKFGREYAEGLKSKKLFLFAPIDRQSKVVYQYPNISHPGL